MKKHSYFVAYNYSEGKAFGNAQCEATLDEKISKYSQILQLRSKLMEEFTYSDLVILNYIYLGVTDDQPL